MGAADTTRNGHRQSWPGWASLLLALLLLAVIVSGVVTAPATPTDRAQALASRLRCPVCQGLSVAESRSETALAMQDQIGDMVADGATDEQVLGYFTSRYGTWVLLDPSDSGAGLLLWILPGLAIVAGLAILAHRRRGPPPAVDDEWREAVRRQVAERRRHEPGPAEPR